MYVKSSKICMNNTTEQTIEKNVLFLGQGLAICMNETSFFCGVLFALSLLISGVVFGFSCFDNCITQAC